MAKKIIVSLFIFILIVLTVRYFFLQTKNNDFEVKIQNNTSNISEEELVNFLEEWKKTCVIYETEDENGGVYLNEDIGIKFPFSNEITICERSLFTNQKYGVEISILDKDDFNSPLMGDNGPQLIIHVNGVEGMQAKEKLMELYEKSQYPEIQTVLGGVEIIKKDIKLDPCDSMECLLFTVYKFEHNDNSFIIEERRDSKIILDNFEFLG